MKKIAAGTSVQNMVHWAQGVRRKVESEPKFAKYDYGQACIDPYGNAQPCNQNMYGSLEPPVYDLKRIQTPLAIFSGITIDQHLWISGNVLGVQERVDQA